MTQAREEQLISDVAETKALLQQFMKEIKPTLATRQEVCEVKNELTDHVESHKDSRTLTPVWIGVVATAAISIVGFFVKSTK